MRCDEKKPRQAPPTNYPKQSARRSAHFFLPCLQSDQRSPAATLRGRRPLQRAPRRRGLLLCQAHPLLNAARENEGLRLGIRRGVFKDPSIQSLVRQVPPPGSTVLCNILRKPREICLAPRDCHPSASSVPLRNQAAVRNRCLAQQAVVGRFGDRHALPEAAATGAELPHFCALRKQGGPRLANNERALQARHGKAQLARRGKQRTVADALRLSRKKLLHPHACAASGAALLSAAPSALALILRGFCSRR